MKTKLFKIDPRKPDEEALAEAGALLRQGGVVAFPTETVYGLGANALCEEAVQKIFKAKGRPSDNPLIIHISDFSMLEQLVCGVSPMAQALMEAFMPGPFTAILKKQAVVSSLVTAGLDTVAVRFPAHPIAKELIRQAGVPVAAPSANLSGKPSPTNARHVLEDMDGRIEAVIDGGDCAVGVESTVVDLTGAVPVILRPGGVTYEDIKKKAPGTVIDEHVLRSVSVEEVPKSPGMKYKHYAPEAQVTVVEGSLQETREEIKKLLGKVRGRRTGVLTMEEDAGFDADCVLFAGADTKAYASKLFTSLRRFDENKVEVVFAQLVEDDGYGLAVKNRLYKAAANHVIHVGRRGRE